MEELKLLIDLIRDLPAVALWVLAGFFVYKTLIVGSIYGVIRFVTKEGVGYFRERKANPPEIIKVGTREIECFVIGHDGTFERLIGQLKRLRRTQRSNYIHGPDVDRLRDALDKFLEKEE